ncbi:hypothetical protein [Alloactinosynnema sp. L-07]|nr:hypothetical protein [Alloactinosynnema sp. L-07]
MSNDLSSHTTRPRLACPQAAAFRLHHVYDRSEDRSIAFPVRTRLPPLPQCDPTRSPTHASEGVFGPSLRPVRGRTMGPGSVERSHPHGHLPDVGDTRPWWRDRGVPRSRFSARMREQHDRGQGSVAWGAGWCAWRRHDGTRIQRR